MRPSAEYADLAKDFGTAAATAQNAFMRLQYHALAESYRVLAESAEFLESYQQPGTVRDAKD
jgi:hypothetical protein